MLPIRDATPPEFATFRELLCDAGYTEAEIRRRADALTVADAYERRPASPAPMVPYTPCDVVHRLWFEEGTVAEADARRLVGDHGIDLALRLGLLRGIDGETPHLAPTVLLAPIEDLYVASDLSRDPADPDAPFKLAADAVYPAITTNTRDFLAMLPRSPCARFLEICAGAGAAALLMARHCDEAVAADVAERSVRFAGWNARLNGLGNVRAVRSDVYGAIEGEVFDRIAAHPPYMPSLDQAHVYRDGGEDGERITRRLLNGLAAHLAPGGDFLASCLLSDRHDAPVEQRVRAMLGAGGDALDVIILAAAAADIIEYYFRRTISWQSGLEDAERIAQRMRAAGVIDIVLCTIMVARHGEDRPPLTIRRKRGARTTAGDLARLLARESGAEPVLDGEALLASRPRLSPAVQLRMSHVPRAGGWAAELCVLTIEAPFPRTLQTPPSVASVLDACDGTHTIRELFVVLRDGGHLPDDVTEEGLASVVGQLVRDGFLDIVPDDSASWRT